MRNWITISESLSHTPFKIDDAYLDELLRTGKWTDHGSDLTEWWAKYGDGRDFRSALRDDRDTVKEVLRAYCEERSASISAEMEAEQSSQEHSPPRLYRSMAVSRHWIDLLRYPRSQPVRVGRFWSLYDLDSCPGATSEDAPSEMIRIHISLDNAPIDWASTYHSRMDFATGSEEAEICLMPGSPIKVIDIEWVCSDSAQPIDIRVHSMLKFVV